MSELFDKVFIINLIQDKFKKKCMLKKLSEINLKNITFINAIDGRLEPFKSEYEKYLSKPFDYNGLRQKMKKFKNILVIEDHSKIGGLASIVKSSAYENKYKGKIINFSLKDEFIHCYGTQEELLEKHGISYKRLFAEVSKNLEL